MIYCCDNYFSKDHGKINLSKDITCCLAFLLEKYDESIHYCFEKSYVGFVVRTLNHIYKKQFKSNQNIKNQADNEEYKGFFKEPDKINIFHFSKFIDILTHLSAILYKHKKIEYLKILSCTGINLIDYSQFKTQKCILEKKVAFLNNISCLYIAEGRFIKAEKFLSKCIEIGKTTLDYAITYNNYCLMQIKKLKKSSYEINKINEADLKKIIESIIYYLHLELNELQKRFKTKYTNDLDKNIYGKKNPINDDKEEDEKTQNDIVYYQKKEATCFLLFNYFRIIKYFSFYEFEQNYDNGLVIIEHLMGKNHFITNKMIRINSKQKNIKLNYNYLSIPTNNERSSKNKKVINHSDKIELMKPHDKVEKLSIRELKDLYEEERDGKLEKENGKINQNSQVENINDDQALMIEPDFSPKEHGSATFQTINSKKSLKNEIKLLSKVSDITKKENNKEKESSDNIKELFVKLSVEENKISDNTNTIEKNLYDEKMKDYIKKEDSYENNINFNNNFDERANVVSIINTNNKNIFNEKNVNKYSKKNNNSSNCYRRKLFSIFGGKSKGTIKFFKKFMQILIEKQKIKIFPELIEDILDYDLVEEMNNLYFIKFPNKTPIICLMNTLLSTLNNYRRKNSGKCLLYLSDNLSRRNSLFNYKNYNRKNKSNNSTNVSNTSPGLDMKKIIEENSNKKKSLNTVVAFENATPNIINYQKTQIEKKNIQESTYNTYNTIVYINNVKYLISFKIDMSINKILIKAKGTINNKIWKLKREISLEDLALYIKQYTVIDDRNLFQDLRYLKNFNSFFQRIIIYYVNLVNVGNGKLQVCFCKFPRGNFSSLKKLGRPEFTFLNVKCSFILTKYEDRTQLIIHDLNYMSYIEFRMYFDKSCYEITTFNDKKKRSKSSTSHHSHILVDNKINKEFDYIGFLNDLFKKIDFIFKNRDSSIKNFNEYVKKYKNDLYQINVEDNFTNIEFWALTQKIPEKDDNTEDEINTSKKSSPNFGEEKNKNVKKEDMKKNYYWIIDIYTLTTIHINKSDFFLHKSIKLSLQEFEYIIGIDYLDIYKILGVSENIMCDAILLNSVERVKNVDRILNETNYLQTIRITKIKPISFYRYKFVFKHIKRFFVCSTEFLVYNTKNIFYRIMIMETISNRTYSKIFIPYANLKIDQIEKKNDSENINKKENEEDKSEEQALDDNDLIKNAIKEKYYIFDELFSNKKICKEFIYQETCDLLTKNNKLDLFEFFEYLVERIEKFLLEKKK